MPAVPKLSWPSMRDPLRNPCGRERAAGTLVAALALSAALSSVTTAPAAAQTAVRFSLDSRIEGPAAPFLLALDKGYYRAEGLSVTIDAAPAPATPATEPIGRVAAGAYDMAVADINALIRYRDAHPDNPVKAVFVVFNRPAFAVIGRKSRGVVQPKDLEGRKLGAPAADSAYAQWPIFVKTTGIDAAKVTVVNVGAPVREPMLAAGQVDAVTGLSFLSFINLKERGVPADDITVLLMADHGVALYGDAVIVNPKFAAAQPDAVRAFLRAFLKGLKDTVRAPATAIDSVMRRNDAAKRAVELERLTMALRDNVVTPEVRANGYGGIDPDRFARAIEQLALASKFRTTPKPDDIFDPAFLPAAAERRAN